MRIRGAWRDPWVWGQFALFALVVAGLPLLGERVPEGAVLEWLFHAGGPRWPAVLPAGAGILAALLGVRALGRNLTPATTPIRDGTLVETGIYRRIRHPIYTGVILGLWGIAWGANGWRIGLLVLALSYLYFDRKAAVEEVKLALRYPGYPAYQRRVPKLLPWRMPL